MILAEPPSMPVIAAASPLPSLFNPPSVKPGGGNGFAPVFTTLLVPDGQPSAALPAPLLTTAPPVASGTILPPGGSAVPSTVTPVPSDSATAIDVPREDVAAAPIPLRRDTGRAAPPCEDGGLQPDSTLRIAGPSPTPINVTARGQDQVAGSSSRPVRLSPHADAERDDDRPGDKAGEPSEPSSAATGAATATPAADSTGAPAAWSASTPPTMPPAMDRPSETTTNVGASAGQAAAAGTRAAPAQARTSRPATATSLAEPTQPARAPAPYRQLSDVTPASSADVPSPAGMADRAAVAASPNQASEALSTVAGAPVVQRAAAVAALPFGAAVPMPLAQTVPAKLTIVAGPQPPEPRPVVFAVVAATPSTAPVERPIETAPAVRPIPLAGLQPSATPAMLPAVQAFGAALHRAVAAERRLAPRADSAGAPGMTAGIAPSAPVVAIAPTAPLDTTQPHWPEAMVARIEQLRDAANETSTRIRLHPDALGTIDVAMRREADAVHVHFAAAEPATQTLLADAQPRLTELAQARGLRLTPGSAATADASTQGQGDRRQPSTPLARPASPPRAARFTDPADAPSDTRLA
ncbi:flagellar hook-length control protein FliK [Sphingomonas sp.]|uniref:flagellar hook-length control protein FliK n=1 Tax=Sphingomonas sp. TaxID=28214 RepID=UPI003CC56614